MGLVAKTTTRAKVMANRRRKSLDTDIGYSTTRLPLRTPLTSQPESGRLSATSMKPRFTEARVTAKACVGNLLERIMVNRPNPVDKGEEMC